MLCDAMCDAGGPNQLADHHWKSWTFYWTRLGIPTMATRLKTHQAVRFFGEFFCPVGFYVG